MKPSDGRTSVHHQQPVFASNARRTPDNGDGVTDPEGLAIHARLVQLGRAGPFDSPSLIGACRVRRLNVDEGMRVPKHELHQFPLELHFIGDVVRRAIGMMGIRDGAGQCGRGDDNSRGGGDNDKHFAHYWFSLRLEYTASTNIAVVQGPVFEPYRPSKSIVGRAACTSSRVNPLSIIS